MSPRINQIIKEYKIWNSIDTQQSNTNKLHADDQIAAKCEDELQIADLGCAHNSTSMFGRDVHVRVKTKTCRQTSVDLYMGGNAYSICNSAVTNTAHSISTISGILALQCKSEYKATPVIPVSKKSTRSNMLFSSGGCK
jgi:hypothetical protein